MSQPVTAEAGPPFSCAYCGHGIPRETPKINDVIRDHMSKCKKHPVHHLQEHINRLIEVIVAMEKERMPNVTASTAAPEPDWVAELVDGRPMHYVKMNKPAKDRWRATLLNIYDEVLAFGEGPTPALAAKACVLKLRAGGAT